ncbi:methyltransferase [Acanthamoeba castellanii str. Neff]|uniref:Methyltransferase n=1 Tax=Acanthamoeba castellanii (strain ATCC 30010 / Neff) TaxID=1257118 RepID=L8HCI1_ACACF|nr:methyltransferase [Acanthamoeba castellanii str. Neff]ELR23244.1 methyltransferase [Acanthamoeba castellanii str. Neff]
MTLKSAAQYEIKGVPIAQLNNQPLKVRYNVFPPTRKDYLSLFANALQKGSPHYLAPGEMRHCLEVGTGTGVLSFILNAHGAKRVTGVDINEDAVLNAQENRALLGKNESELAFVRADLFPAATDSDAKYDLLVCNPPWLPMPVETAEACPHNPGTDGLMGGVLDRRGDLLPALFRGLTDRLSSRGRLWLIYSDLSIKLGLQDESWLKHLCEANGLLVRAQTSMPARVRLHPQDPFYQLKKGEVLTLYEIVPKH